MDDREKLITDNILLVRSLAKRFSGKGIEYEDIFQSGCVGLVKAADNFDASRGLCFSTYAVPVILGEMRRLFRDGGSIRVSRELQSRYIKISSARKMLEAEGKTDVSVSKLSEKTGLSVLEISEALSAARPVISLTTGENGESEIDVKEDRTEQTLTKIAVDIAVSKLDETSRKIVSLRFMRGLTQNQTAVVLGMSQVAVSRAERQIKARLKNFIGDAS